MRGFKIDVDHIGTKQQHSEHVMGDNGYGLYPTPADGDFSFPFRLLDDDGNLYYEGRATDDSETTLADVLKWGAYMAGAAVLTDGDGNPIIG